MALSKRLAILGAQSPLSVAKPRCHVSSYNLINRRQISKLTKDSNLPKFNSKSKSNQDVDDSIPEIEKIQAKSYMLHAENRVSFEMFFSNVGRHRYVFRVQLETVKNKKEFIIFSLPAIISMSIIIAVIISHELDLLEARQAQAHDLSTPNQIVKEKDLRYEQLEKQNEETRHSLTLLQQFMEKQFPGSFPPSA